MSKKVKAYIIFTLLISWGITFVSNSYGKLMEFIPLIMAVPAMVALLVRVFTEGITSNIYKNPKAKGFTAFLKAVGFAILYPLIFVSIGAVIGGFIYGQEVDYNFLKSLFDPIMLGNFILASGTISAISALGEEYGWRAFLLPELSKSYSKVKASSIVGVVWAFYHIPVLILLTSQSNIGNPYMVALIQGGAAFMFSYAFSYCYFISNRVYPTVIMHTFWNLYNPYVLGSVYTGSYGMILSKGNVLMTNGEGVYGVILGGILSVVFIYLLNKQEKKA